MIMNSRREPRFVVAHTGSRDRYQVALALQQRGLLVGLVTDFYSKSGLVERRNCPMLDSSRVVNQWNAFVKQGVDRVSQRIFNKAVNYEKTDRIVGERAYKLSKETCSSILAYSGGIAAAAFGDRKEGRYLFLFHPLASVTSEILEADADRFPIARNSYLAEWEVRNRNSLVVIQNNELSMTDYLLTASTFSTKGVADIAPKIVDHTITVPYGCPSPRRNIRDAKTATRFLFVGQGVQRKGLHHLLMAWKALKFHPAQASLTLVVRNFDRDIISLADDSSVTVIPGLSSDNLKKLMAVSDVLVLPSLAEGYGLVINEALAAGLHVISTPNTGAPDLDLQPGSCTLVPVGDLEKLSHALEAQLTVDARDPESSYETAEKWSWTDYRRCLSHQIALRYR